MRAFLQYKKDRYSYSLGCTQKQLREHLEMQFMPGMSWDNHGKWHIDHIYPLSKAYKEGPEAFARACHYTNLQPLWAIDNLRKHAKISYVD